MGSTEKTGGVKASHLDNQVGNVARDMQGEHGDRQAWRRFKCLWHILLELSCRQKDMCF